MKKIIVTAVVMAFATLTMNAQDGKDGGHMRHHRGHGQEAFQELNLSADQKAKFKSLNEDFRSQMGELKKKEDNITVKEWKTQMESLRKDRHAKMQNILTSDQKAQLEKMKQDRKAKHEADGKARQEKMKARLGLTDDQVAKLNSNRSETSAKMKALRDDKSLNDDQRKQQVQELRKKQKESFESILTKDQLQKLHEGHQKREKKATT
jgi:Spy/CpxP family protein refolding chaperone